MEYKKYNKIKTALNPLQDINNTPFNRKGVASFRYKRKRAKIS